MSKQTKRKAADVRKAELAIIHLAKKDLGLDDDTYRDLLEQWTGKRSSGRMSQGHRQKCIENFKKMGFEVERSEPDCVVIEDDDAPQIRKIKAMWLSLWRRGVVKNPSLASLNAWVKRVTGGERGTSHVNFLTPDGANTVIEALKAWQSRA